MLGLKFDQIEFLGLNFAHMDETQALEWLLKRSREMRFSYVVTPNVDHMVQLHRDPAALGPVYEEAHLRLCDSKVISLMGRWSGLKLPVVTGSGLTARMLSKPLPAGTRIAMVGGNQRQREWLAKTQPEAVFFYHEPPMGLRTNLEAQADAAAFVETVKADIILITCGAPQSELIANLIHMRGIARGVALCVGASLEFITGEKRRAPAWIQKMCMEWAFRLYCEPRRLARRYLIDGPQIFAIWRQWTRAKALRPLQGAGDGPFAAPALPEANATMVVTAVKPEPGYDFGGETPFADPVPVPIALPQQSAGRLMGASMSKTH